MVGINLGFGQNMEQTEQALFFFDITSTFGYLKGKKGPPRRRAVAVEVEVDWAESLRSGSAWVLSLRMTELRVWWVREVEREGHES
jgi:hypothetical protein